MKPQVKSAEKSFHWKYVEGEIILVTVRWTCSYGLSTRNLVEMMAERSLNLAHTTRMKWNHEIASQINKRIRLYLKRTCDSWRGDVGIVIDLVDELCSIAYIIGKVTKPCLEFKSLRTASKAIAGIEAMHTLWIGQLLHCFTAGLSRAQIVN